MYCSYKPRDTSKEICESPAGTWTNTHGVCSQGAFTTQEACTTVGVWGDATCDTGNEWSDFIGGVWEYGQDTKLNATTHERYTKAIKVQATFTGSLEVVSEYGTASGTTLTSGVLSDLIYTPIENSVIGLKSDYGKYIFNIQGEIGGTFQSSSSTSSSSTSTSSSSFDLVVLILVVLDSSSSDSSSSDSSSSDSSSSDSSSSDSSSSDSSSSDSSSSSSSGGYRL